MFHYWIEYLDHGTAKGASLLGAQADFETVEGEIQADNVTFALGQARRMVARLPARVTVCPVDGDPDIDSLFTVVTESD